MGDQSYSQGSETTRRASSKSYSHWFWHSRLMDCFADAVSALDTYLWRKRSDRRFR